MRKIRTKSSNKGKLILNIFLFLFLLIGVGYSTVFTNLAINGDIILLNYRDLNIKQTSSTDRTAFRSDTYRENIKTITLNDSISSPSNVIESWDISENGSGGVMAYIVQNADDNTKYDLYIQGRGRIYSNKDSSYLFYGLTSLERINGLDKLTTTKTTNMSYMFSGCNKLVDVDLSNFNMSKVTNTTDMLTGDISLSGINTPKVYPPDATNVITLPVTLLDISDNNYSSLNNQSPTQTVLGLKYNITFYEGNIFQAYNDNYSGLDIDYNTTTEILTLNGSFTESATMFSQNNIMEFYRYTDVNFVEGDIYRLSKSYVSGSYTMPDDTYSTVAAVILTSSGGHLSQRFYVDNKIDNLDETLEKSIHSYASQNGKDLSLRLWTQSTPSDNIFNQYKIKIDLSKVSYREILYGTDYGTLPTPTRDGYIFEGWYLDKNYTNRVTSTTRISVNRNFTLYAKWKKEIYDYSSVGSHEFNVPYDGLYRIELWGAQGTSQDSENKGGLGGYVSGKISLDANETFYIYVGEHSNDRQMTATFNGGGQGTDYGDDNGYQIGYSGGGATDIRTTNGNWDNFDSLKTRIMVAGAGGGTGALHQPNILLDEGVEFDRSGVAGAGGGLKGIDGDNAQPDPQNYGPMYASSGGTQTKGGLSPLSSLNDGGFGYGGYNLYLVGTLGGAGGGSGYFGAGGSTRGHGGAGGGSSYISGHKGCVAIAETSTSTNITQRLDTNNNICADNTTDIKCSYHYSDYIFTETIMIDGKGCKWTDQLTNDCSGQVQPTGIPNIGHIGNGYARITFIGTN